MTGTVGLAGVVLAAGLGTRLRPLTELRPKALCPVANRPLLDWALARLEPYVGPGPGGLAVNAHHHAAAVVEHVAATTGGHVHVSVERGEPLGTAGALGRLREWLDGRDVLVTNADAWLSGDLEPLVAGWDGERVRLLTVAAGAGRRADFADRHYVGAALMPARLLRGLTAEPAGLYEVVWRQAWEAGQVELVSHQGEAVDCGRPADYLRANLLAAGPGGLVSPCADVTGTSAGSVIGAGAVVRGEAVRCVVWDGARVETGERLEEQVRAVTPDGRTVTVDASRG